MTLISKIISGNPFIVNEAQVSCPQKNNVLLSYFPENVSYSVSAELNELEGWLKQKPEILTETFTHLQQFLSFIETGCTQIQETRKPSSLLKSVVSTLLPSQIPDSPLSSTVNKVQELTKLLYLQKKFLHGIPSIHDDKKTVMQWINKREYSYEISYNETENHFEISDQYDQATPLAAALKEIQLWLTQEGTCFSDDPPSSIANHSSLLVLLEANLLSVQNQLQTTQKNRTYVEQVKNYMTKNRSSREAISPLLAEINSLIEQVKKQKKLEPRIIALARDIEENAPLHQQAISELSLEELQSIQKKTQENRINDTISKYTQSNPDKELQDEFQKEMEERIRNLVVMTQEKKPEPSSNESSLARSNESSQSEVEAMTTSENIMASLDLKELELIARARNLLLTNPPATREKIPTPISENPSKQSNADQEGTLVFIPFDQSQAKTEEKPEDTIKLTFVSVQEAQARLKQLEDRKKDDELTNYMDDL